MSNVTFPTELIELPSGGKFYPEGHPLREGKVELKYMTAKEEDILTSTNLIQKGVVLDKLMDSLVVTKGVSHEDFLLGDLNAVMVASRILGYGKDYPVSVTCPKCDTTAEHDVDLSQLETKEVATNDLTFTLPVSKKTLKVRLLTRKIEKDIQRELDGLKKLKLNIEQEATTRLRHIIVEVDGSPDQKVIRETVDNMLVADTRAFREFYKSVTPDINFESVFVCESCSERTVLPFSIGVNFFWPDEEYKLNMHKVIFSMVYYGKGGFNFEDLYNMPVFLRSFYLKEMNDAVEKQNAEIEKATKSPRR